MTQAVSYLQETDFSMMKQTGISSLLFLLKNLSLPELSKRRAVSYWTLLTMCCTTCWVLKDKWLRLGQLMSPLHCGGTTLERQEGPPTPGLVQMWKPMVPHMCTHRNGLLLTYLKSLGDRAGPSSSVKRPEWARQRPGFPEFKGWGQCAGGQGLASFESPPLPKEGAPEPS